MSIIDTLNHSVVSYDPKSSKPFSGQRLSKVSYKTIKDVKDPMFGIKRDSKCVSIPLVDKEEIKNNIVALTPHIQEYLMSVQDKIVREKIDAGAKSIAMADISIAGMIEWLESNSESGRLTKESVGTWFDSEIAENLALALAEKLGVSEIPTQAENNQIMAVVSGFKDKISSLAGGKTAYAPKMCETLIKALAFAPAGDALASRFTARLSKMMEVEKGISLEDLL